MATKSIYFSDLEEKMEEFFGRKYDIQADSGFDNGFVMYGQSEEPGICMITGETAFEDYPSFAAMLGFAEVTDMRCYGGGSIFFKYEPVTDEYLDDFIPNNQEIQVKKTDVDDRALNVSKLSIGTPVKIVIEKKYAHLSFLIKDTNDRVLGVASNGTLCNLAYNNYVSIENPKVIAVDAIKKDGNIKKRPTLTIGFELKKK